MTTRELQRALKLLRVEVHGRRHALRGEEIPRMLTAAGDVPQATATERVPPPSDHEADGAWQPVYRGKDRRFVRRDQVLIALMLATGLRISEVCALQVGDLEQHTTEQWWIHVRSGKGRKARTVPLAVGDVGPLLAYLAETGRPIHSAKARLTPLFESRRQGHLSRVHVWRIIHAVVERAQAHLGNKHITPHSLRHTYAFSLLRGDAERSAASVVEVAELLGHASIKTTEIYLRHLAEDDLAALAPAIFHWLAEETESGVSHTPDDGADTLIE
jgi:integrase